MIYRSKVDSTAPTVLITLIGCQIATGLILLIGLRRFQLPGLVCPHRRRADPTDDLTARRMADDV